MQILPRQKKNGKTSYTVRIRVQGYPPLSKTFPTHREAISWGKTAEGDLLAGRLGSPLAQLHTLRDAIERFLEEKPPGYGSWLQGSPPASPVLITPFGSTSNTLHSSSAKGLCSSQRGTSRLPSTGS